MPWNRGCPCSAPCGTWNASPTTRRTLPRTWYTSSKGRSFAIARTPCRTNVAASFQLAARKEIGSLQRADTTLTGSSARIIENGKWKLAAALRKPMPSEVFRRRNLPHWDVPGAAYFLTTCLHGSIPAEGRLDIQRYLEKL